MNETTEPEGASAHGPTHFKRFDEAQGACAALHSAVSTDELVETLKAQTASLLECEQVTVFLREGHGGAPGLVYTHKGNARRFPIGEGIIGTVARDLTEYVCNDPANDAIFVDSVDGMEGETPQSIAATPMRTADEEIGVLAASSARERNFEEADLYLLRFMAHQGSLAFARLRRETEGWALVRNLAKSFCQMVDDRQGTVGRGDRIRKLALALGREVKLSHNELLELELATWLRQVGRVQLSSDAELTEKREDVRASSRLGAVMVRTMMQNLDLPESLSKLSQTAADAALVLDDEDDQQTSFTTMSLPARVLKIAATFELLTTQGPAGGSGPLSDGDALERMKREAGQGLDPGILERFEEKDLYRIERRRFPRFDCEAPMDYALIDDSTLKPLGKRIRTRTLDLGESGVRFRSDEMIPDHVLLEFAIHLPANTLSGYARVARQLPAEKGGGYEVGAYFMGYEASSE